MLNFSSTFVSKKKKKERKKKVQNIELIMRVGIHQHQL